MRAVQLTLLAWLVSAVPCFAQGQQSVPTFRQLNLSTYIIPASLVNGGGSFTPQLFGPQSCTVPAYSYTGATTSGWGFESSTACVVVSGTQRLGITSSLVTSTVPVLVPAGTAAALGLPVGELTSGLFLVSSGNLGIGLASGHRFTFGTNNIDILNDTGMLRFGSGADVVLARGALNRLDLASGDTFNVVSGDVIVNGSSVTIGVATGYKIARGSTAFDGGNPTTVATGLTTVVSCTATLLRTTAVSTGTAFVTHAAASGANVDFYAWILAGTASTNTETFEWICVGT